MSDIKKSITEADKDIINSWFKARPQTPAELATFVEKLVGEYNHDYGTICHAVAAAACAAAHTVDADPAQGGITGFQGSAVMWEFVRRWMHYEGPLRLLKYDDLLYPQYEEKFDKLISLETATWLKEEAQKRLAEDAKDLETAKALGIPHLTSERVLEHWRKIAEGWLPFGFKIGDP